MGERHHRYVWYDDSSKQSGGGQASISQRHLGSDVLTRICSEKKKKLHRHLKLDKCHVYCTFDIGPIENINIFSSIHKMIACTSDSKACIFHYNLQHIFDKNDHDAWLAVKHKFIDGKYRI